MPYSSVTKLVHGSLFSGTGGFDLAAEWMGWENAFHCEWNPFGQTILKYYWPNAESYGDITQTDFSIWRNRIDVLTGGFPCQPYSVAGKRRGKEDDRHLWPHMLRAIREIQPRYVVGENVAGLISWSGGLVFHEVQSDLEDEGYEVWAYVLPACAVNAPHRRDRVWFVAHSRHDSERKAGSSTNDEGCEFTPIHQEGQGREFPPVLNNGLCDLQRATAHPRLQRPEGAEQQAAGVEQLREEQPSTVSSSQRCDNGSDNRAERHVQGNEGFAKEGESAGDGRELGAGKAGAAAPHVHFTNTHNQGLQGSKEHGSTREERTERDEQLPRFFQPDWEEFPTQSPVCSRDDGFPALLDADTLFRMYGIEHPRQPAIGFARWRNESIKAFGNAIVPQVALEIFKAIAASEKNLLTNGNASTMY